MKVFQHDRITRAGGGHDLLTQDVISILPKPRPSAFEFSQMPFGRLAALLLQRADLPKIASFDRFPAPLSQEATRRCDRRSIDAQIHTDDLVGWLDFWRRNGNDTINRKWNASNGQKHIVITDSCCGCVKVPQKACEILVEISLRFHDLSSLWDSSG
jgi:hypothetical protein